MKNDVMYAAGIVGSRRRNTLTDKRIVNRLVDMLYANHKDNLLIVSGHCSQGADTFVEEAAAMFSPHIKTLIFPVDKKDVKNKWDFRTKAFERNIKIAQSSTSIFALVAQDRMGGTENTIEHALSLKKPVFLVLSNGDVYLSQDGKTQTCDMITNLLA